MDSGDGFSCWAGRRDVVDDDLQLWSNGQLSCVAKTCPGCAHVCAMFGQCQSCYSTDATELGRPSDSGHLALERLFFGHL
jgi:hypothetical protein